VKRVICLSGPDGSGKSTLARLLAKHLSSNRRVKVSWLRGSHTAASLMARFLSLFSNMRGPGNPYYGISIPSSLRPLWWFLEFASMLPRWFLQFLIPGTYGVVVGERGLLDFLVWVCVTTDVGFLGSLWGRATLALATRYCRNVLVTASPRELVRRKGSEPTAKTIPKQWVIYRALSRELGLVTIDTTHETPSESLAKLISGLGLIN